MKGFKLTFTAIIIALTATLVLPGCIEDGYETSPSSQPVFSTDTLDLGVVFTAQPTPTYSFKVYNRHDKILTLSRVALRGDAASTFRLNVDGTAGAEFSDIDIRPNDSIFVFVEATVGSNGTSAPLMVTDYIDFTANGVTRSVVLTATGRDVTPERNTRIETDTRWEASEPRLVYDTLRVAAGVTLTLGPGMELFFHDSSILMVEGTLVTEGTPEAPVVMTGDRTDNVVADIPFDLMAAQWEGIYFTPTSTANSLSHTVVKNMAAGVMADSVRSVGDTPGLLFHNCRIRNSAGYALASWFSDITAIGTEFSDAALTPLLLTGGNVVMNHVTVANYYLFAVIAYPLVCLYHFNDLSALEADLPYMTATFDNCIFYGLGQDINTGNLDDTDVYIRRTVFKSDGEDDDNFISCIWDTDPLYLTVRDDYYFDYRLQTDSPVIGRGDESLTLPEARYDFYGTDRLAQPATPGAFAPAL